MREGGEEKRDFFSFCCFLCCVEGVFYFSTFFGKRKINHLFFFETWSKNTVSLTFYKKIFFVEHATATLTAILRLVNPYFVHKDPRKRCLLWFICLFGPKELS